MKQFYLVACIAGSIALVVMAGCDRGAGVKVTPSDTVAPVSQPVQRKVRDFVDYTGRANAKNSVVVQPRVTGYLVTEGFVFDASNEAPIVITSDYHGLATGDKVNITGVLGNTKANGEFIVTVIDADRFSLDGSKGNGAWNRDGDGKWKNLKDTDKVAYFKEGDFVSKDQVLFKVDPRPYKAQLEAAQAAVAQNKAGVKYAEETNALYKDIAKNQPNAVGPRELAQYKAQEDQAKANLDLAKANLKAAELNLEWTVVKSKINGQVGRVFLTPGNLVNQDVTQLTTVVSLDPMYVYFDMDEPTLLRIKKAINEKKIIRPSRETDTSMLIALAGENFDEKNKARQGAINFIDNQVNPGTGSISVRGVVANAKPEEGTHMLTPGMFVRVRLWIGQPQEELLVIDRAITSDQGLKYVYVLDENNKVKSQPVSVGALQEDGLRVITSGVEKDDWVLVGALQQVRPGMTVKRETLEKMPTLLEGAAPTVEPKGKDKKKKKG